MFALNAAVKIADKANFYFGRVGIVAERAIYGDDMIVYTVHIPSPTGNATISFATREAGIVAA